MLPRTVLLMFLALAASAEAAPGLFQGTTGLRVRFHKAHAVRHRAVETASSVVGGRPPGCPYQFCGCGASLHLFGRIIPALNRAAAWFRFPRAEPAPGMAAVRQHHVFVLERHLGGDQWLVYDANSGGHATRIHARSIAGYVIVKPTI